MIVRLATASDIPSLIEFQLAMAWETENLTLDKVTLSKGIESLFHDPAKGNYYVTQENEVVIGCLMITYEWSDWRNGNVLWVQSVYIHKQHRAKGVYKKMYQYIQELVKNSADFRGIRLYVDKTNLDAQKVYQQLGMDGEHYQVFEWMNAKG